jgi:hypothetical protein
MRSGLLAPWSKVALAASVALILLLPAFMGPGTLNRPQLSEIKDLTVMTEGDRVSLTWTDGDQVHRVMKATSREQLRDLASLPAETVRGNRWTDSEPVTSGIVYYVVE